MIFNRVNFNSAYSGFVCVFLACLTLFGATYLEMKSKWLLGLVLIIDICLACGIESKVSDIKQAIGVEDRVIDLLLEGGILAFLSFLAYYGFANSLKNIHQELDKKKTFKSIKIKIDTLKDRLYEADLEIANTENKIAEMQKKIAVRENAIIKLNQQLEYLHSNVVDVRKSLDSFATGWFNYISAKNSNPEKLTQIRTSYYEFLHKAFIPIAEQ